MLNFKKGVVLILGSYLLNGCDSNYHLFDGLSGYKFSPLTSTSFSVQYYGNEKSSLKDVTAMWHHKARELCKGGAYTHKLLPPTQQDSSNKSLDSSFLPKDDNYYLLEGTINCLAPNHTKDQNRLLSEHLPANQLVGGRTTN
ncbi:hypothetical protein [Neptuniibacter marinus]|uniref:hypothetical protein n=1 Tax=Neptuniibacter marinus TaxID=1806670 RepID=UPI00082F652F|nr:hypothetical protein [Neptuniibacter marinus]